MFTKCNLLFNRSILDDFVVATFNWTDFDRPSHSSSGSGLDKENRDSSKSEKTDKIVWYSCPKCAFKTKYKANLKGHCFSHQTNDETVWYTCTDCSFKSKWKGALKKHYRLHNNNVFYSCTKCNYKTKWKGCLTRHSLIHKSNDKILWYTCTDCNFKSKRKDNLLKHYYVVHKKKYKINKN